jgi:hypothetical protein
MELLAQVVLHLFLILFVAIAVPISAVIALATMVQELIATRARHPLLQSVSG